MASSKSDRLAESLAADFTLPPGLTDEAPDPEKLLFNGEEPPAFPEGNIFPLEWRVETPKLEELYEKSRDPGWSPERLPWDTLDVDSMSWDERYAVAYWFALLSVFDASGPAVFARAMIHTYETHEEAPIRKCFFAITRDEHNHEEVCQRAIQTMVPNGPLDFEPRTVLGKLARHNIKWYYHNGARYWTGYNKAVSRYPLPILFTSFLFGEVASSTLFSSMHEATTIPVFKEAFRRIAQDEARHRAICMFVLKKLLPALTDEEKSTITRQLRAGFVFLSGILYEPPEGEFWELPAIFRPAHRLLEEKAREAGLGVLSVEKREENWREAVLKMKGVIEPYGIAFPALPEIGVDGETVAFDPNEEFVAVF
ncbi:ferritin family protein [Oceanibacterium hippocampi]|uniref:Rubrerythrin n=1 Tax=Oceanibacterium hippocampi TaxID=745714 RepID=A0A1Y5TUL5_9PROT|nr:ferritin family protein [Oceanibacterium hippocampi]SLN72854.1 Rubrerythrin [Oceanibacterium hippocampi]